MVGSMREPFQIAFEHSFRRRCRELIEYHRRPKKYSVGFSDKILGRISGINHLKENLEVFRAIYNLCHILSDIIPIICLCYRFYKSTRSNFQKVAWWGGN